MDPGSELGKKLTSYIERYVWTLMETFNLDSDAPMYGLAMEVVIRLHKKEE